MANKELDTEHYFWELFKQGFMDSDIRCEDNDDITKKIKSIYKKYKDIPTIANYFMLAFKDQNYLYDEKEMREMRWYTIAYLQYYKV